MALAATAACFLLMPAGASASVDPISVSTGQSCFISPEGGLNCWGSRTAYTFILGPIEPYRVDEVPTPTDGLEGTVTDVSTTRRHTCAVADGGAFCWGLNGTGELGDGTYYKSELPKAVIGLSSGVTDIAVADEATCAVKSGALYCWGYGMSQLFPDGADLSQPAQVPGLESGVTSVSIGSHRGCAVASGQAICWGWDADLAGREGESGDAPPGVAAGLDSGVEDVSVGTSSSCAIVSGEARCWGRNNNGQLGDGTTSGTTGAENRQAVGLTTGVTDISVGNESACAVVSGAAKCWGRNTHGTHGNGTADEEEGHPSTPVAVSGLSSQVDAISVDWLTACARHAGAVKCWGTQHSIGSPKPVVKSASPVEMIDSDGLENLQLGYTGACGVEAGVGKCAGDSVSFEEMIQGVFLKPLEAPFNSGTTAVSSSVYQFCGIVDGAARCRNGNPDLLEGLESGVQTIAAASRKTCAATATVVRCWYPWYWANALPVTIEEVGSPITSLTGGYEFHCAIAGGGAARCWGNNSNNELGAPSDQYATETPVTPIGLTSGVTSIAAGDTFACAVVSGAAKCWGDGSLGQLGNGETPSTSGPVQVTGLTSGVASVAAGSGHACARMVVGTIYCWGANDYGQLGDGSYDQSLEPVLVDGIASGAVEISAYGATTCARVSGVVKCWGNNSQGQFGNGTIFWQPVPWPLPPTAEPTPRVVITSPRNGRQYLVNTIPVDLFNNFEGTRECKLDGGPFTTCPDTLTNLSEGAHTLQVKATGDLGESAVSSSSFNVDTLAPTVSITGAEDDPSATYGAWRSLSFSTSEILAIAYCKVDDDPEATCLAGTEYSKWFAPGLHTVTIRAFDKAGRTSTTTVVFEIGTDQPAAEEPSPEVKPLATARVSAPFAVTFSLTGSYKKGTRKLIARAGLGMSKLQAAQGCRGFVILKAPKLGTPARKVALKLDSGNRCVASRTFSIKRSWKGKKLSVTAEFVGNDFFLPVKRSGSKTL
jgi:alpha-tubulin suppressor-like RCC1 family protein